jgi:hypothetical protein
MFSSVQGGSAAQAGRSALYTTGGLPLITMEQAPHTSSRQFISQLIGDVVFSLCIHRIPLISIKAEITFIFGRYGISNSSW